MPTQSRGHATRIVSLVVPMPQDDFVYYEDYAEDMPGLEQEGEGPTSSTARGGMPTALRGHGSNEQS